MDSVYGAKAPKNLLTTRTYIIMHAKTTVIPLDPFDCLACLPNMLSIPFGILNTIEIDKSGVSHGPRIH